MHFVDRYLDVPFDLSQVIFIATANYMDGVPEPLRDRMEVISLPGYTEREKLEIAKRYLVRRQLEENGLKPEQCEWQDEALRRIINDYTHEAGVRELERQIGAVCRAWPRRLLAEKPNASRYARARGRTTGSEPITFAKRAQDKSARGRHRAGLYAGGGEVLHIEATRYPGKAVLRSPDTSVK